ncbi:MAG: HAMP domain-containing histidine kinase [Clostridiaceae bacterium]|nr:HAMP domain-containing histidine kinase [Clostridiaceae bacterium]
MELMEQLTGGGMHTEQIAETAGKKDFENGNKNKEDMINPELVQALGYDWISALSHEFRTPLNVILSTIQMVQLSSNCSKEGEYRQIKDKYLNIMKQNCLRLLKMVNNIIDINRINSDFFQIDPCNEDIVRIVKNITLSVKEYASAKNIDISFSSNCKKHIMACDTFQLERILLNLLSNAIKFTPYGGTISVILTVMPDKVYVSVSDSGQGIPEKYRDLIFERFSQTDGKSFLEKRGSGMGLFLVKKLLERMNGEIWVSSSEGKGSTFTFFLRNYKLPDGVNEKTAKKYDNCRVECLQIEFSDIYV